MKFKKLFAVVIILLLITLASCAGGGKEDTTEAGSEIECLITACDVKISDVLDRVTLTGKEAEELLEYFTYSEYYETVESIMYPRSFTVSFYIYDENGECVPMYDCEGALNEFFVQDTDTVYSDTVLLGNLPGAYEKLFGYIIEKGSTGGYFCNIYRSQLEHIMTRASGESVRDMYRMLAESEYQTETDRTTVEKEYIVLGFWGAASAQYYIYSDDYVEVFDSQSATSLYQPKGRITGIYQKALDTILSALRAVTEEETKVGYKLNCIIISGKGERAYSESDFYDVDCIYIEDLSAYGTSPEESYYMFCLYFENCTLEKLEEKIAVLQKREDMSIVSKLSVRTNDNPALD